MYIIIIVYFPAIIGIGRATESNPCIENSNGTSCIPADSIRTSLTDARPTSVISNDSPDEFLYWMAGATGCGVLFAIIATLSLWALEDVVRRLTK